MDDDVAQMFRAVNERIKRLETSLKDEKDAREGLEGSFKTTDGQVDAIVRALGAWMRGSISSKIDDIDKAADDIKKRVDALEKKVKK
jgi:chaperonin cofactor prefoldin